MSTTRIVLVAKVVAPINACTVVWDATVRTLPIFLTVKVVAAVYALTDQTV